MDIKLMAQLHPGLGVQSGIMYNDNTGKSRWILTRFLRIYVRVPNGDGYRAGSLYRAIDAGRNKP
jgi:hypothetical protein